MKTLLLALALLLLAVPAAACSNTATIAGIDFGSPTVLVPGVPGQRVYICGYLLTVPGATSGGQSAQGADLKLYAGTGANCADDQTELTPQLSLAAGAVLVNRGVEPAERTPQGYSVCFRIFGMGSMTGILYWAQYP